MGLPIAFALTGGEVSDFKGYLPVMNADGPAPKVLLGDKGYDADFIRQDMADRSGVAMIPTKRNRLVQLPVDAAIYALRNMVERCFNKLKNARRLATRYDKTADSYLGFIHLASIRLWMREFVNASYVSDMSVNWCATSPHGVFANDLIFESNFRKGSRAAPMGSIISLSLAYPVT